MNQARKKEDWLSYLSAQEIPILQYTHLKLNELHQQIDNIDLRDIGILIKHDPLLSLKLFKKQENVRSRQQITDVTTLERILLMIGLSGFFKTFGSSSTIETQLKDNDAAIECCRQTCARAFLASQIAEALGSYRRDMDPNEIITAALLHETAEILLWIAAPKLMLEIKERLKLNPALRSKHVQTEILGCGINEIQLSLVQSWHLPKILSHLIDEEYSTEPRVQIVTLATSIARHTEWQWNNNKYLEKDIEGCANLLNLEKDEAYEIVRHIVIRCAKQYQWFNVQTTAARIIEY